MHKTSTNQISYIHKRDRSNIRKLSNKVSDVIIPAYYGISEMIGVDDAILEINESKSGIWNYHRGHHVKGVWVLGIVERTCLKRIKFVKLENRSMKSLTSMIKKYTKNESTLYTDGWKRYNDLKNHYKQHLTVNHSKNLRITLLVFIQTR